MKTEILKNRKARDFNKLNNCRLFRLYLNDGIIQDSFEMFLKQFSDYFQIVWNGNFKNINWCLGWRI